MSTGNNVMTRRLDRSSRIDLRGSREFAGKSLSSQSPHLAWDLNRMGVRRLSINFDLAVLAQTGPSQREEERLECRIPTLMTAVGTDI